MQEITGLSRSHQGALRSLPEEASPYVPSPEDGEREIFCPTEAPERRVIADRYEVEQELGSGGMGVVVAARDTRLHHRVAIKMLHPQAVQKPEIVARFYREARAAAALQSDHAARILDSGVDGDGRPYIVMELLEGEDLAQALGHRGSFTVEEAALIILQACDAIGEAHGKGIIHRDLKPANLFLARRPSGAVVVKVLDFGISKQINAPGSPGLVTVTGSAAILGSPVYMSPEQLRTPHLVDARTDVYSLSATLYELLVGRPPFLAETVPELCAMILKDEIVPPGKLRLGLPHSLEAIIMRGLSRDRDERLRSIAELADLLRPFAGDAARLSSPPSSWQISLDDAQLDDTWLPFAPPTPVPPLEAVAAATATISEPPPEPVERARPAQKRWLVGLSAAACVIALAGAAVGALAFGAPSPEVGSSPSLSVAAPQAMTAEALPVSPMIDSPALPELGAADGTEPARLAPVSASGPTPAAKGDEDSARPAGRRRSVSTVAVAKVPEAKREQPSPPAEQRRHALDMQLQ